MQIIMDVSALSQSKSAVAFLRFQPLLGGWQFAAGLLFLVSAIMIYTGVRNGVRERRLPSPRGLHWILISSYFALGAGGLIYFALPVFYSGQYVHGGRELLYHMLALTDVALVGAAAGISVFAYTSAYSIPDKQPES
jgi:hypothetical protein